MVAQSGRAAPLSSLPYQPTPFIGREKELSDIARLLDDPICSLLTVVGPGGMGKTRLAIEAARHRVEAIADGVYFVNLEPLSSADAVVPAMASALNVPLTGQETPLTQLLGFLAGREMLLVLDNFEHVLEAADELAALLFMAPEVKLLVTSREALKLQEEWLYPLDGLSFPSQDDAGELSAYGAVQLFVERARRVRPNFSLMEEAKEVARICQLVGGIPLAIELAASWIKTLSCSEIAFEIEANLNFLATELRNVPARHRSMQAVVLQTWGNLNPHEQEVFARLSVFRGGFGREAARAVSGAPLPVLTSLADKSLLRWQADKRFHIHEHLRQFAAEKLAQSSSQDLVNTIDSHCAFYARFLHDRFSDTLGGRQRQALLEIESELDNIRIAWHWAVDHKRIPELQQSAHVLSNFFQFRGRYLEAKAMGEVAILMLDAMEQTRQTDQLLVIILVDLAWIYIRTGRIRKAEEHVRRCQETYQRLAIPPLPGTATDPLLHAGVIASINGNYDEAIKLGLEACRRSEVHNHSYNRAFAYYVMAEAKLALGDYESARRHAQQAYAITQETQDRWFTAYCLNDLGLVALALEDYSTARGHFEASYAIRQAFDDPEGMAVALSHLGEVARCQRRYADAQDSFQRSQSLYKDLGDKGGLAKARRGLGLTAVDQSDVETARQNLHSALSIAAEIQFVPLILCLLADIGELLLQTALDATPEAPADTRDDALSAEKATIIARALEFLSFVANHQSSDLRTKEQALGLLDKHRSKLSPSRFSIAVQNSQDSDLQSTVLVALALSSGSFEVQEGSSATESTTGSPSQPVPQSLVDPLTPRELEVLQLIAKGLTNRQIADRLFLTVGTVKYYTSQIYSKLQVSNRTQAVSRAGELKLLL